MPAALANPTIARALKTKGVHNAEDAGNYLYQLRKAHEATTKGHMTRRAAPTAVGIMAGQVAPSGAHVNNTAKPKVG